MVNVNFGTLTPLEVGPAAVGQSSSDVWNLYYQPWATSGSLTNLLTADGSITEVGLTVDNAPGVWALTWSELVMPDPMYDVFIYPFDAGHAYATITNLPDGAYDFYVYSHDGCSFELYCGGESQGYKGVAEWGSACMTADWDEGQQYVVFRNVTVTNGQSVVIDVTPGYTSYAMLSGLQIAIPFDIDQDGLPDWWEKIHFGNLAQTGTGDYDSDGMSNLDEYQYGTDPNTIRFSMAITNQFVANRFVPVQLNVEAGMPSSMSVLVDNTNFANAAWSNFTPSFTANLGTNEGWHAVWVGLRGLTQDAQQTWVRRRIKLDTTPPSLVVTNCKRRLKSAAGVR